MRRREALTLLAGGSGLALLGGLGSLSLTREEALTIARTVVGALWRTSLSESVAVADQLAAALQGFLEGEPAFTQGEGAETARLLAEVHILQGITARHLGEPEQRLKHLQQAKRYAYLSGDPLLEQAALTYLGYSYNFDLEPGTGRYGPRPQTALAYLQQGLAIRGGPGSPALEASLFTGLAEAYSLLQEPKQAAKALAQSEERYAAASPANDPGYRLADSPPYSVPLWRARVLLNLGQAKGALQALEESQRLYPASWQNGRGLANLQVRRMGVALALGDQDLFVEALGASIEGVQRSGSRYGREEVRQLLREGQARWPQAKQLEEWAMLIEASA